MNVRRLRDADLDAVAALAAENDAVLFGRPSRLGLADVRGWLAQVDVERDSWLYHENGAPLAVSWFFRWGDVGIFAGVVAQAAKKRGLGARIVETGERRAREREAARAHAFAPEPDTAAAALFEGRGFRPVRRFYELAIELASAPPEPVLPDGMTLERFDPEDARDVYEVLDSAFQDHWEHVSRGFEQWWEDKHKAGFDPTLWFLVRDGDEIAAAIRNEPERRGGGYVAALGVARPWRGRGLGRALLLRTFAEFRERGVARVTLGVDAENPTGATRLYESVGMRRENAGVVYEKVLR